MTTIVDNLWSWQFLAGVLAGFTLSRAWCMLKVWQLDRRYPLPDGRRRDVWAAAAVDARWVAGVVGAVFLIWSVVQTQENANENARIAAEAKTFAAAVQQCQSDLIASILGSRAVTTDNDRLSLEERALLADGQRLGLEWLGSLVSPPPDIDRLEPNDPARSRYFIERTRVYFNQLAELNRRIDALHAEQANNERARPALPDPDCGT
ncbi:hypothetical protein SEA_PAITO_31 [Mycobacterium phage Paito]|uniref:Uncharacterized protein n=1 Tax=Mycobacterium phage Paito TaxID=2315544 RepID=A0A386KH98_9CAUD|nr:hypothetical protein KDW68_gp31 [Mycobacterium phage Paito]AYD84616.1 hypothetical protein SEA_PAITO_31 [Mycobacterium phage Paito]